MQRMLRCWLPGLLIAILTSPSATAELRNVIVGSGPGPLPSFSVSPHGPFFLRGYDDSIVLEIRLYGEPMKPEQFVGSHFTIGNYGYDHMIAVTLNEGTLTIEPTPDLEPGIYELEIWTRKRDKDVARSRQFTVYVPLSSDQNCIEHLAAELGSPEQTIRDWMLLDSAEEAPDFSINTKPMVYEGEPIYAGMHVPLDHESSWFVNGDASEQLPSGRGVRFVASEPGLYVIASETRHQGELQKRAHAMVRVVSRPAIALTVPAGKHIWVYGPLDYRNYLWTVGGEQESGPYVSYFYRTDPGYYEVECLAQDPYDGEVKHFIRQPYRITVE